MNITKFLQIHINNQLECPKLGFIELKEDTIIPTDIAPTDEPTKNLRVPLH